MSGRFCRVYWGSHGCSLERGHAELGHECGRLDGGDEDGLCSRIDWSAEHQLWLWRFANDDETYDGADEYPTSVFGEDLPAEFDAPVERVDALRARWQDEGRLAVWEGGGWVKRVRPS